MIFRNCIPSLVFCCLILLSSCGTKNINGYTTDPSRKDDKISPNEIHVEFMVVNPDGSPVNGLGIKAETRKYTGKGITNSNGVSRFNIKRLESESILFTFEDKSTHAIESLHHLPSKIKNVGLVFERSTNSKVRLSHYSLDGLHR